MCLRVYADSPTRDCLLSESLDTTECMSGEQRPAHVQDDLNLCILRMFEGTFSLDADHVIYNVSAW